MKKLIFYFLFLFIFDQELSFHHPKGLSIHEFLLKVCLLSTVISENLKNAIYFYREKVQ